MPLLSGISAAMPMHFAPMPVLTGKVVWQKDKAEEPLRCVNSGSFKDKLAIATNSTELYWSLQTAFLNLASVCARNMSLEKATKVIVLGLTQSITKKRNLLEERFCASRGEI